MKVIDGNMNYLEQLAEMLDAYRVFYRYSSDIPGARNFLRERIANNESVIYLVIDGDESAAGFSQCYPLFSSTRMQRLWLLNDLFVKPEQRGKGVSKMLLDRCKSLARETNASGVLLETEKTNVIGNNLYPSAGFELYDASNFYFWKNPNKQIQP